MGIFTHDLCHILSLGTHSLLQDLARPDTIACNAQARAEARLSARWEMGDSARPPVAAATPTVSVLGRGPGGPRRAAWICLTLQINLQTGACVQVMAARWGEASSQRPGGCCCGGGRTRAHVRAPTSASLLELLLEATTKSPCLKWSQPPTNLGASLKVWFWRLRLLMQSWSPLSFIVTAAR